jgi:hypothetical protein
MAKRRAKNSEKKVLTCFAARRSISLLGTNNTGEYMKGLGNRPSPLTSFLGGTFFLLLLAGMGIRSDAKIYSIANGNSSFQVNDSTDGSTSASMASWLVDNVNQVNQEWFYYRIGSTGQEYPIENLSSGSPSSASVDGTTLTLTYANSSYSAVVKYSMNTANAWGSGKSQIGVGVNFFNNTGSSQPVHLFEYDNFDLTAGSDAQSMAMSRSGNHIALSQTLGSYSYANSIIGGSVTTPIEFQVAAASTILSSLTDNSTTTLVGPNSAGPIANVAGAIEWDALNLASGSSLQLSETLSLQVPEPSALALIALGLIAWAVPRKRRA